MATSSHPNRSRRKEAPPLPPRLPSWLRDRDKGKNPSPEQIRQTRWFCGATKPEIAAALHRSLRAYEEWEAGRNKMHPNDWFAMRCICHALAMQRQAEAKGIGAG